MNITDNKEYITVFPETRLDLNASQILEKKLMKIVEEEQRHLLINFRYIDYLHSSGIRLMMTLHNRLLDQGNQLLLCEINDSVKKIIDFVDLHGIVKIFKDEAETGKYIQSL